MQFTWTLLLLGLLAESRACEIGFKAKSNKCVDENECEMFPCGSHANCTNTKGSYFCLCHYGFKSRTMNFTATTGQCEDVNECRENHSLCPDGMECENTMGSYVCKCPYGFERSTVSSKCEDVDECVSSVCDFHSICNNTPGSFFCSCSPGFLKHQDDPGEPCTDTDECEVPDVCGINAYCHNLPGSYFCRCHSGYSNYGNNQSKCLEMNCGQFESDPDVDETLRGLLSLLKNSCESLTDPGAVHQKGEELLENLCTSTEELLSEGNVADAQTLSHFLGVMEKSLQLIGPQLKDPVTRMETHNTYTEVAVKRGQTPPEGRVLLQSDSALFNTSWETVVGTSYPGFAFVALVSYKDLNTSSDFLNKMENRERSDVSYQLGSRVVTAVVSNPETEKLSEPVTLVFTHVEEGAESESLTYSCVYWDEAQEAWSGRGCERVWSNSTHTVCSCSHLSSFAVLMALYPVQDTFELVLITRLGLVLSLVCLFLCILTFHFCRPIQGTRTTIHLHLSLCLFIADLVFLCGITSTNNQVACGIVAGLLHFFFLAAFCWMLLEGLQLYRMVVLVFHTTLKHLHMCIMGYGVPLAIVTVSAIAFPQGYGTRRHCWLSLEQDFIWSFFGPVCTIIIINCFFFIITVWKLAEKFSSLNPDVSKLRKIRSFTVTAVAQLCVLGGMWVFGCFLFQEEGTEVMSYLFTILNSLQGALIFIMHCLLSKTVREEYCKLISGMCSQKKKLAEFSSTQSSQQPLRSHPSTSESKI